ncbi:substrate-binding periplasmic protein [Pseudomonas veronii]|uniref:Transporter substrate-binding domain-containing protein n=1 Tax=Pseudomonas veronii TaxID=76761 RepID=A0A7Y1F4S1_PSEVE|nr:MULTISPECIES: transporter substrate-binding domain-containing protein [Pseudomonas]AQY67665.1 amino acid ABC transporter substrate-binding protein [Pseudomonas veronii]MCT8959671.1 transporter substrate-binding domain-containing protein [Pseudomonas veronii]MCT9825416.1 transporter substrate-binding domain-containing protein [Pseudomonas veronii]NMX37367.1 transporter substrate-binding domain-containing protein [Pseudomonas veronii]NMX99188.1 transporter substrate-binding domain-containing 
MFSPWRLAAGLTLWALGTVAWMPASAAQLVRIGAAHFPPYTVRPEQGADTGLLPQLVEALNASQTDYQFVLVPTSIPRRFRDFEQGRVDVAIFENPDWGWQKIPHTTVDMGLEDAEIFVAQREPDRDQNYFASLGGKRLAVFSGYHYAFANFNADPKFMAEHFNATLTYSHDSNLLMVARGRADIALVTRSYLSDFLARNVDMAAQFLISERVDQVYHHYALLRPKAPISSAAFAGLLKRLRDDGELLKIFEPYRIDVTAVP